MTAQLRGDDCTIAVSGVCAIVAAVLSFILTIHEIAKRGLCSIFHSWVIEKLNARVGFQKVQEHQLTEQGPSSATRAMSEVGDEELC
jgi:hypothetical protein